MKKIIIMLLIASFFQIQAQKKKTKTIKKTTTQKVASAPQMGAFATLNTPNKYRINTVVVSPDGNTILSSGDDGEIRLWNIATQTQTKNIQGKKATTGAVWPTNAVAYNPNGNSFVSGSGFSQVIIWDVTGSSQTRTLNNQGSGNLSLAYSPDGLFLATGCGNHNKLYKFNTIRICETATGKDVLTINPKNGDIISLAFSPDGQSLAAVTSEQEISLWDVNSGTKIRNFDIHNYLKDLEYANKVAFTPDGKTLITGGFDKDPYHGVIKLWNTNNATLIRSIKDGQSIDSLVISHDGLKFATGNFDSNIKIWEIVTGKLLYELVGHRGRVSSLAFTPDDKTLVSGGEAGTIKLWDVSKI
jgi:WD40 repeat protein